jgi:SAM-dependent methyltransferase
MCFYTSCKICDSKIRPFFETKKIVECVNCKSIFFQERLDPAEVTALYKKLYDFGDDISYHAHIHNQELINRGIQPELGYNKKVIIKKIIRSKPDSIGEIGAGVGVVGKFFMDKNFNYAGIELDNSIANKAKASGINIQPGSFENLHAYKNSFDALLAFEVVEHIDDLKLCLTLIHHSLRKKGKFGFSVPNFNKRKNYQGDPEKLYQPNPPIHVNFFTKENIPHILKSFGFQIEYLKARPFPDLNFKKKRTYIHLLRALVGRFEGSTINCIAVKE